MITKLFVFWLKLSNRFVKIASNDYTRFFWCFFGKCSDECSRPLTEIIWESWLKSSSLFVNIAFCVSGGNLREKTDFEKVLDCRIVFENWPGFFRSFRKKMSPNWWKMHPVSQRDFFVFFWASDFQKKFSEHGGVFGTFLAKFLLRWLKLHSTCPGVHFRDTNFLVAMSSLQTFLGLYLEHFFWIFIRKFWYVCQNCSLRVQTLLSKKLAFFPRKKLFLYLISKI